MQSSDEDITFQQEKVQQKSAIKERRSASVKRMNLTAISSVSTIAAVQNPECEDQLNQKSKFHPSLKISEEIVKCSKCTKQFIREGDMQRHYEREHTKVVKPKPFVMVQDKIMQPASPSIVSSASPSIVKLQAKESFFPRNTPRNQSGSVEQSAVQTPKEVGKTYFVNMPQAKGDNERPLHLAACCSTF